MKWKSFAIGFLSGVAVLSALNHWRARPQNLIASWPNDENKKGMEMMAPWVTNARAAKLGPFVAMVPASPKENAEACLQPAKGKPWIFINRDSISILDSKNRMVSVTYDPASGTFRSYSYTADLINGPNFIDKELTGTLEKISPPAKKR